MRLVEYSLEIDIEEDTMPDPDDPTWDFVAQFRQEWTSSVWEIVIESFNKHAGPLGLKAILTEKPWSGLTMPHNEEADDSSPVDQPGETYE